MIIFPIHCCSSHATHLLALGLLLLLYAETHYHFRFAPSLLYRRQPEVIADAPHRLEPGQVLPVFIIVKDAHRFPIILRHIRAEVQLSNLPHRPSTFSAAAPMPVLRFELQNMPTEISAPLWWRIYPLELPAEMHGQLRVNVGISYRCRGKERSCWNDNHPGTSHAPLHVMRSPWPLPTLPNYYHGDLHFHSDATSDQVEFGAPVEAMREMARAQGLQFCAVTDHSYDLDDDPEDYLHNDPALRKWHLLQESLRHLNNASSDFVILPGEEVSCRNARGGNVHFLIFNHPHFIPGSGDGGEKWLRTTSEHSVLEILDQLDPLALAFAAHPLVSVPFLEKKLLRRDVWQPQDFVHTRLHGMQFWNGGTRGEEEGLRWWRQCLLQGKKLSAIAGNDAHGNFNRFRQIALPALTMAESQNHVFGRARTVLKLHDKFELANVLEALRHGRTLITNGAFIELELLAAGGKTFMPGENLNGQVKRVRLVAKSSPEFGELDQVTIWWGDLSHKIEETLYTWSRFVDPHYFAADLEWQPRHGRGYVRAEVITRSGLAATVGSRALTNPIWVSAAEELPTDTGAT